MFVSTKNPLSTATWKLGCERLKFCAADNPLMNKLRERMNLGIAGALIKLPWRSKNGPSARNWAEDCAVHVHNILCCYGRVVVRIL